MEQLRQELCDYLGFALPSTRATCITHATEEEDGYRRLRIHYLDEDGAPIPAFLLLPFGDGPFAAVLVHHQHHGQRHLGKSEVCGLAGDPLQAFGPRLVQMGIAVLAPDSICFEDRRKNRTGTEADAAADVEQHYNEMCYRLLRGDTLMRKVLSDSALGITLLQEHPLIASERIGMLGHSYGGNTTVFHAALDERIRFACTSGAVCSYQHKLAHQIGIEMAEVIPGFAQRYDLPDLITCCAPRPLLVVSATDDKFSQDADAVVAAAHARCQSLGLPEHIEHKRYAGGHALTPARRDAIEKWLAMQTRA